MYIDYNIKRFVWSTLFGSQFSNPKNQDNLKKKARFVSNFQIILLYLSMPHHNSNIVKHRYGSEGYEGENLAATAIMLAGVYTPMLKLMRELLRRKGMTPSLEQWFRWFRWCLKKVTTHANKVSKSLFTFC